MASKYSSKARKRNQRANRIQVQENDWFQYNIPIVDSSHIEDPPELLSPYYLYDRQKYVLAWMEIREALYNTDERRSVRNGHAGIRGGLVVCYMGFGKTITTLTYVILKRGEADGPTLIVCSKTIMNVWKEEIDKFYGGSLKYLLFHKDFMKASVYNSITCEDFHNYDIVITTYHTVSFANPKIEFDTGLENPVKHGKFSYHSTEFGDVNTLMKGRALTVNEQLQIREDARAKGKEALFYTYWERVVCDESQVFANWKTHMYKSMLCLSSKYKWCLTGTPIRNKDTDIWSQLRFCGYLSIRYPTEWSDYVYRQERLYESLYIYMEETLPPKNDNVIYCDMNMNEQRIYDACLGRLRDAYANFITRIAGFQCVLTEFLRCRQSCVAPYLLRNAESESFEEEDIQQDAFVHDRMEAGVLACKILRIVQIIEENPNDKFLVFSTFKEPPFLIADHLENDEWAVINGDTPTVERGEIVELFSHDPKFKVLFLSYRTGSEGLNLTAANHVILTEPWWTPVVHEQAIKRSYRQGQDRTVTVDYILIRNTIEDRIREICLEKRNVMADFLGGERFENTGNGVSADLIARILGVK